MPCTLFSVQKYIGFRLGTKAVPAISHADFLHIISRAVVYSKNSLQNFCAILSALTEV